MSKPCPGTMKPRGRYDKKTGLIFGKMVCNHCGGEDYGAHTVDRPFQSPKERKPCKHKLCTKCGKRTFPTGPCTCK